MKDRSKQKIIGGMFGLEEIPNPNSSAPPFLDGNCILLANARSGIALLIDLLSPTHVWMPSYLCSVMVKAAERRGTTVKFYEVDFDLNVPSLTWLDDVQPNDLVVLIDYFGFPCDQNCIKKAKERGAWVLEDACQALLSEDVGRSSDFVLYSPRKYLGIPDGGILVINREIGSGTIKLKTPPEKWWLKAFSATLLRAEFDRHGGTRHWFKLFQETEVEGPIGNYAMSEFSRMIMQHSFDYLIITQKRGGNYQLLANELYDLALLPNLPPKVVPLGFPIRVENRDRVRQTLFNNEIYPPVHWEIQGVVPEEFCDSHRLASEIMTLPCDQRYDKEELERMIAVVLREAT